QDHRLGPEAAESLGEALDRAAAERHLGERLDRAQRLAHPGQGVAQAFRVLLGHDQRYGQAARRGGQDLAVTDHTLALLGVHGPEEPLLNVDDHQGCVSWIQAYAVTHRFLPATGPTVYRRQRTANSRRGP